VVPTTVLVKSTNLSTHNSYGRFTFAFSDQSRTPAATSRARSSCVSCNPSTSQSSRRDGTMRPCSRLASSTRFAGLLTEVVDHVHLRVPVFSYCCHGPR